MRSLRGGAGCGRTADNTLGGDALDAPVILGKKITSPQGDPRRAGIYGPSGTPLPTGRLTAGLAPSDEGAVIGDFSQ